MQVYNRTPYIWFPTMGMDVEGREHFVLVIKGSFAFPDQGVRPKPLKQQMPFVCADTFYGEPGYSGTRWETDFAFRKPKCDVVMQGAAYAPGGKPCESCQVGLRIGGWQKVIEVVGHREWLVLGPSISTTRPVPFKRMEFSYDTAFGGYDRLDPEVEKPAAYVENPAGRGFATVRNQGRLQGAPLPNTQEVGRPVTSPYEDYAPMAFGPISRGVPRRLKYGGTYDQNWQDKIFPFLPRDFDERYHQQVGPDQQIAPPSPGSDVVILNMTPRGREAFKLPDTRLPVALYRAQKKILDQTLLPDTLIFDPELRRLAMVWRVSVPIRRTLTEIDMATIGTPSRGLMLSLKKGKAYHGPRSRMADLGAAG